MYPIDRASIWYILLAQPTGVSIRRTDPDRLPILGRRAPGSPFKHFTAGGKAGHTPPPDSATYLTMRRASTAPSLVNSELRDHRDLSDVTLAENYWPHTRSSSRPATIFCCCHSEGGSGLHAPPAPSCVAAGLRCIPILKVGQSPAICVPPARPSLLSAISDLVNAVKRPD